MTKFFQVRVDDEKLAKAFEKKTPEQGDRQRVLLELVKLFVEGKVKV